jgi:translation elongation factor EF-1alpha
LIHASRRYLRPLPELRSFAIRDMGQTIAAGTVLDVTEQ